MGKLYSFNGEDFYEELADASHQLRDEVGEGSIIQAYEGEQEFAEPVPDFISVADIVDTMRDRAWDAGGEHADDYLKDLSVEAENDLHALLVNWVERHKLYPSFWRVINIKPVAVRMLSDGDMELVEAPKVAA